MRKRKKIDDYIEVPIKKHEDSKHIEKTAFERMKKISNKKGMPEYDTPESFDGDKRSNEEE